MVKRVVVILAFLSCCLQLSARHITGGEMFYEYLGFNGNAHTYRFTLKLYRDCFSSGAQLDAVAEFGVFAMSANGGSTIFRTLSVPRSSIDIIELTTPGPCITNPPSICYEVGYYITTIQLPPSTFGYTVAFQRCCRVGGIENVFGSSSIGATYSATVPGNAVMADGPENTSARFTGKDTVAVCANSYFEYDFGAYDADGDSLAYEFCDAYIGGSMNSSTPSPPESPPYANVPYQFPFAGNNPLETGVTINRFTGLVSGTAPYSGIYVVTVCVSEYRRGQLLNVHRKDLQIAITGCQTTEAVIDPEYRLCEGYTLTIRNKNSSPKILSQKWDFGDPGSPNNISSELGLVSHTFSDTGVYRIMLITNPGGDCSDTTYSVVRVFPGFSPDFSFSESCANVPIPFRDITTTTYGVVDFRRWDFGDLTTTADVSTDPNPSYTYGRTGRYNVTFIVGTSKGCRDTIVHAINVLDKPPIQLTNDTLICDIDTLQLNAIGNGTFTWSPNYNISTLSGNAPLVSPDVPTKYYVYLETVPGCANTDSVFVDVRSFVTISAGKDTTICLGDSLTLVPSGDALRFEWEPSEMVTNPVAKSPGAAPPSTQVFRVTGHIGKCEASDDITVRVVPYPEANAGPDMTICYDSSAMLTGRMTGAFFTWTPGTNLRRSNMLTPIATPLTTTEYILTVTDTLGCPKPVSDTAVVYVVPKVIANAGNDTAIVLGQPLQLIATGGETAQWSPIADLSNPEIASPIAMPTTSTTYYVRVSTQEGCYGFDTIEVKVFRTGPDIFVPNAFTPNGDGINDEIKPIPVGIAKIDYFRIYNRWGQLVYSSPSTSRGWDGTLNGKHQPEDTYVWMTQGVDYKGQTVFKKGTVVLTR